jgi:hypothetical protein
MKLRLSIRAEEGEEYEVSVKTGEIRNIPIENERGTQVTVLPDRRMDLGFGKGKPVTRKVFGGSLGLIIDLRGRPLQKYRNEISAITASGSTISPTFTSTFPVVGNFLSREIKEFSSIRTKFSMLLTP